MKAMDVIRRLAENDPFATGFHNHPKIEDAALYRISRIYRWEPLADREFDLLDAYPWPEPVWSSTEEDECQYHIFGDHSLYFDANANPEVWSDARDFLDDWLLEALRSCVVAGQPISTPDQQLLAYLGVELDSASGEHS